MADLGVEVQWQCREGGRRGNRCGEGMGVVCRMRIKRRCSMARRRISETRPTIGKDDSLELQSRGVGNEGGNMGETVAQGAEADAEKSPLANDAGMEGMVKAVKRNGGSARRAGPSKREESSPEAQVVRR